MSFLRIDEATRKMLTEAAKVLVPGISPERNREILEITERAANVINVLAEINGTANAEEKLLQQYHAVLPQPQRDQYDALDIELKAVNGEEILDPEERQRVFLECLNRANAKLQKQCHTCETPNAIVGVKNKSYLLQRCSVCKYAVYCSSGCQHLDWDRHKNVCHIKPQSTATQSQ